MILQFANPKIYIYAITAMSLYILPVYQSFGALCGFTVLLSVIGASGTYVWALFGAAFCKFFLNACQDGEFCYGNPARVLRRIPVSLTAVNDIPARSAQAHRFKQSRRNKGRLLSACFGGSES